MELPFGVLLDYINKSREIYRHCGSLRRSVYNMMWCSIIVLAAVTAALVILVDTRLGIEVFLWTLPVVLIYTAFILFNLGLLRDPGGSLKDSFQGANITTAVRIFLVAPVLVLLFRGILLWGIVLYCISALTDVIDGLLARRFRQETVLGIMLDPVGDILSTAAVFSFLWISGDVPLWLFIILLVRYVQFFAGLAFLTFNGTVPELHPTLPGKIVGVIQAGGIVILLTGKLIPGILPLVEIGAYLFPVLGLAFFSVIVSQTIIGWKALKRET